MNNNFDASEFNQITPWLDQYIQRLGPDQRKQLMRDMAIALKKRNRQHITRQKSPNGRLWQKRKNLRDKRGKMFLKLKMARHLKHKISTHELTVGFSGNSARIAKNHHYGLRQQLKYGIAQYPKRKLLGINKQDESTIMQMIFDHIENQ